MDRRARGESFKLLLVRIKSLDRRVRGEKPEHALTKIATLSRCRSGGQAEILCLPPRRERATRLKLSAFSVKTRRAPR